MPRHRAASPRYQFAAPLAFGGAALGTVLGAVAFAPTASAAEPSTPSAASGCDRQVRPDRLDSALAHAALGEVVCVPGDHSAHRQSQVADADDTPPRVHPAQHVPGRSAEDLREFSVADLVAGVLGGRL